MARILIVSKLFRVWQTSIAARPMSEFTRSMIGCREIVGSGFNGQPNYHDRADFPFPAIRWKETSPEIMALKEKEKGDWRKLTVDEKKELYRASFRQTFAEFQAPTGNWKSVLGLTLMMFSFCLWGCFWVKVFVYSPLPDSFKDENRAAMLRRIIDLQVDPIKGVASLWDYENDDWIKNVKEGKTKKKDEEEE